MSKRYTIAAMAHNLGRILRSLFGVGKPRVLQGEGDASSLTHLLILRLFAVLNAFIAPHASPIPVHTLRAA